MTVSCLRGRSVRAFVSASLVQRHKAPSPTKQARTFNDWFTWRSAAQVGTMHLPQFRLRIGPEDGLDVD